MQFKLKLKTDNGSFSVCLNRNFTKEETTDLIKVANNVLFPTSDNKEEWDNSSPLEEEVKKISSKIITNETTSSSNFIQDGKRPSPKFGKCPVAQIQLGSYVEVDDGLRIKMLPFPAEHRIEAVRILREHTGITIVGCRDIIDGNYPCPILSVFAASEIYAKFRKLGVYCKLISAEKKIVEDLTKQAG